MLAIILSRRDFREADQIISLHTLEKGKVEVLARGVKKIISKNSAHLEPFSLVQAEIVPGKQINHLTKVTPIDYFVNIRQDLQKSLAVGFVVSLLDKILHEGERDGRIFDLIIGWLKFVNLQSSICNLQLMDGFMVKLLHCLGLDITQAEDVNETFKKDLQMLNDSDWLRVSSYKFQVTDYKKLHNFIYQFIQFQLERKIGDWAVVDKLVDAKQ